MRIITAALAAALTGCGTTAAAASSPAVTQVTSAWERPGYSLDRDCGYTVPVSKTRDLWIFCDTAEYGPPGLIGFIPGSTAAAGTYKPGQLSPVLSDLPSGSPALFIPPPVGEPPVPGGYMGNWPSGAALIPGTGKVLIPYGEYAVSGGAMLPAGWGIAVWSVAAGVAADRSVPGIPAGLGSPVFSGGYLYLYLAACASSAYGACAAGTITVARVPAGSYLTASAYRWLAAGGVWSASRSAAVSVIGVAKPLAVNVARLVSGGFVLVEQTDIAGGYRVWLASAVTGRWSLAVSGTLPCTDVNGGLCRAVNVHPELSAAGSLALSWFDPGAGSHGHVVFSEIRVPGL